MAGESKREKEGTRRAEARGWLSFKIAKGNMRGLPDRFYGKAGRAVFIEWKDEDEPATRQQQKRHDELRAAGFEIYVCDNPDESDAILT